MQLRLVRGKELPFRNKPNCRTSGSATIGKERWVGLIIEWGACGQDSVFLASGDSANRSKDAGFHSLVGNSHIITALSRAVSGGMFRASLCSCEHRFGFPVLSLLFAVIREKSEFPARNRRPWAVPTCFARVERPYFRVVRGEDRGFPVIRRNRAFIRP